MIRTSSSLLVALAVTLVSTAALGQTAFDQTQMRDDRGFRLHASLGYPALMALGVGWKFNSGTELLVQGGGTAVWAFIAGTAEASVTQEFLRRRWGSLHVGAAGSYLHGIFFVIDCYGDEVCEDRLQNIWFASPRLGVRLNLDQNKLYGALPYLDLSAGPQLGFCNDYCPSGDVLVSAAVHVRGVLDWRKKDRGQ